MPARTFIAALAAMALAAAAPVQAAAETLRFVSWQFDEHGAGDWWRDVIARFETEHPGVDIEIVRHARSHHAYTMSRLFAGGEGGRIPHIVHLAAYEYRTFAENGWLEDLDPWLAGDGIDLDGWASQDKCRWNGRTACIMLQDFGAVMAYNAELLAAAGVDVPTSYAQFIAAARATTRDLDGDGVADQYGTAHGTWGGYGQFATELLHYVLDAGAYWTDAAGGITIDTPEMVAALARWKTIYAEGLAPRRLDAGEARQLFADGHVAMRLDGPWLHGAMRTGAAADAVKIARSPLSPPVGGSADVLGMAADISDEQKRLVWEFIKVVMSPAAQRAYATVAGGVPPRPDVDLSGIEKQMPHFPILVASQQAAKVAGVDRTPAGLERQYGGFSQMVQEEVIRMVDDDLDPANVAATMQQRAELIQCRGASRCS